MNRLVFWMAGGVCLLGVLTGHVWAASPPNQFQSGQTYSGQYVVSGNVVTGVVGGGTATLSGFWDARRDCKTLWKADGSKLYIAARAQADNNFDYYGIPAINAANFQIEGKAANTGLANEVFEFDAGFSSDRGSGVIGDTEGDDFVGGLTTMRVHNARLVTHASQSLPTSWKQSRDASAWYSSGAVHTSHHGLLIFDDIVDFDGSAKDPSATSNEWHVRSSDQTYDGGLYWKKDWTLDVADGLTLSSNTHFEQAAVGPHVGFGTQSGQTGTTVTKTGNGALVIARGGIQGYGADTTLNIQQGRVEFNSNETQNNPNYYLGSGCGQNLDINVSDGAEVGFHAYTYPIDQNWCNGAGYGPDSLHQINRLDASGTILLGGLWTPSSDAWDQAYYDVFESGMASPTGQGPALEPETALAREAKLDVLGSIVMDETTVLKIVLGSDSSQDAWQVNVGQQLLQNGELVIIDDGTLGVGEYDLFDASEFHGNFDKVTLPAGWSGSYGNDDGVLSITAIPEPATMSLLAFGGLALLRRRSPKA